LVYRKATDFSKLILYPVTLLKVFTMCKSFLEEVFRSFRYKIMSSTNRNSLTSSLPIVVFWVFVVLGLNSGPIP
jgi:hypothetical protein